MKKLSYLKFLPVLLLIVSCGTRANNETAEVASEAVSAEQSTNYLIGPTEFSFKAEAGETLVLDVRTPQETAKGIIRGATIIDYRDPDFKQKLSGLDKEATILVYCASGGRSKSTQQMMNEMGFRDVYDLKGGIRAWQAEGMPVVQVGEE